MPRVLTSTAQFKTLPFRQFFDPCVFRLQGVVTLADTSRNLLVLQDAAGALAVHFPSPLNPIPVGERISLEGTNCHPYVVSFPDFPYRPAGREVSPALESPTDWGEYNLTRMRGWLRPPESGDYTFWIASDNSSELWLSADSDPANAKRIAFIPRYGWVSSREWSRYPSQRSETVFLKAGVSYYLEALQEQTTMSENLAVAWQGPHFSQSVIDGPSLIPWAPPTASPPRGMTNGILREYWTNFSAGDLSVLHDADSFASAVSVESASITPQGPAPLPAAKSMALNQPLPIENNFRWVRAAGRVTFAGISGDTACLELTDGDNKIQIRARQWDQDQWRHYRDSVVQVQGVCEGAPDQAGTFLPAVIWTPSTNCFSPVDAIGKTGDRATAGLFNPSVVNTNPSMSGFYFTKGVVLFNDRVFGKDYLFIQEDTGVALASLQERQFKTQLQAGQWVELGGNLKRGRYAPVIDPLTITELGWHALPAPVTVHRAGSPENTDGRWTEAEGICQAVNTNGTITIMEKGGPVTAWIGRAASGDLRQYVDARLRARGALSETALDGPLLLVPSPAFVDVDEPPPADPFAMLASTIAKVSSTAADDAALHRVKIRGNVVYRDRRSFVIQDQSAGIRVKSPGNQAPLLGAAVEVVGFPVASGPALVLTEALWRPGRAIAPIAPADLNLNNLLTSKQHETLVQVAANLVSVTLKPMEQVLELQEQEHLFAAVLPIGEGLVPPMAAGSRIRVTGIFDDGSLVVPAAATAESEKAASGSPRILLRSPRDIGVLRGPPWWTLKKTIALVGTLVTVLLVTLLWVYLLRRRLERQQAARVAFSRQILQGQESERQRIAVNLHDSLGQNLLVIKGQARRALQLIENEAECENRLNKISEITSQAIEEVRQITRDLRPYQLDRLGLTQAIRASVNQASENSSILFATYLDSIDNVFDKESEIHVYRIVQEGLNNILKHSAASEAAVVVKNLPGGISLSLRDNGRGFDPEAVHSPSTRDIGYGLTGMRERTRILGGSFTVVSSPGQGTHFTIEIPKPLAAS